METKITVAAVGDIFMGRGVEDTINAKGPGYIFDLVRPYFCGNDIVLGNLESPISGKEVTGRGLIAKPAALDELKEAGFNAVAIANNHIMDFGLPVLRDTIDALQKRNIGYAGAGLNKSDARQPLRRAGGKDVVLLAYYGMGGSVLVDRGGQNEGDISKVLEDIRNARDGADIVLVAIHWGRGTSLPMRHQVEFAHRMIDNGANAVLGSGPHILQPAELYNGGVIAYSLGNFVFDHRNMKCKQSMILHISFTNGRIENVNITPVLISDDYRPQPVDPATDPMVYESIKSLLVHQLDEFESDAKIIPLGGKGLMMRALKKIIGSDQRAYPLSVYFHGFVELIKERVLIKN